MKHGLFHIRILAILNLLLLLRSLPARRARLSRLPHRLQELVGGNVATEIHDLQAIAGIEDTSALQRPCVEFEL